MVLRSKYTPKLAQPTAPHPATGGATAARTILIRKYQPEESEPDEVIDLGGPPRVLRSESARGARKAAYVPNPRLYPGPASACGPRASSPRPRRRRKRKAFRRALPNSRLYQPAPPRRRLSPPAHPAAWPRPASPHPLDTASRVALRLTENRRITTSTKPPTKGSTKEPLSVITGAGGAQVPGRRQEAAGRLVVALPTVGERYRPLSEQFRPRAPRAAPPAASAMDALTAAPAEDGSDGNDTMSAPSEYLAEFLSAIMRRQHAEALKYCRLILQYEPHNATARGFYPLLQDKLNNAQRDTPLAAGTARHSSSDDSRSRTDNERTRHEEVMSEQETSASEQWGGASGSWSPDSLELDPPSRSSPEPEPSTTPPSDPSNHTDSGSGSGGWWDSAGSEDDNGNAAPRPSDHLDHNDNAAPDPSLAHLADLSGASSLQRLRAQFACSIK